MQYFTWGINRAGVGEERAKIIRTHWDFIARYDDQLIARGPVLDPVDTGSVIGSIHIVELRDRTAAEKFAYEEPFAAAGLFGEIILCRFALELPRTQFEFQDTGDKERFFVYCPAKERAADDQEDLRASHEQYCQKFDSHFVCRGSLLTDKGDWNGGVFFLEGPSRSFVDDFLTEEPYARGGLFEHTQIYRWTMGGPENLNASGSLD